MSAHPSELLATKAVDAIHNVDHVSSIAALPESLKDNIATAIDMLREGSQQFIHVGRDRDAAVAVTQGTGELGGGIWPLRIGDEGEIPPVGLRLKGVLASVVTLSSASKDAKVKGVKHIEGSRVLGLGENVIVEGEYAHSEVERALEDMGWLMHPSESVLVVGNGAINAFLFGMRYSAKHHPPIQQAIFTGQSD